jgi:hypothetical protein
VLDEDVSAQRGEFGRHAEADADAADALRLFSSLAEMRHSNGRHDVAMPDYESRIEYWAPDLVRSEFRRLRAQLTASLREQERVRDVQVETAGRLVEARLVVAAGSSSSARALAEATARILLRRVRFVPLSGIRVSVDCDRPDTPGAERSRRESSSVSG